MGTKGPKDLAIANLSNLTHSTLEAISGTSGTTLMVLTQTVLIG
jgi:hypothetical protein